MSRYFVTKQTVSLTCGIVTVRMTTNTTQHLWLLSTTKEPSIIPRRDRRLNNTVPHQNNHTLWIEKVTEQQEPGNTTEHTFVLQWPAGARILFFYSINMATGSIKATRSAIYAYQLEAKALLGETWSNNGHPDLNWQFSNSPPAPPPNISHGTLWLDGSNFGARFATLDLVPYLGNTPNAFCNLFLTVKLGAFYNYWPTANFEILVQLDFTNTLGHNLSRNLIYDAPRPPCTLNPRNSVGLTAPGQLATLNFQPAFDNTSGICGAGMDPIIANAWPTKLTIEAVASAPAEPPLEWIFAVGSIFIADYTGQLIDVSRYWRSKRLSPKLP